MARLDRGKLMDAVRAASGFRGMTRQIEDKAERTAIATSKAKGLKRVTGTYEDSFKARFVPVASKSVLGRVRLENDSPWADVHERGRREFKVRVRNKKVLYSKKLDVFFGKEVTIPKMEGKHVIRDALLRVANGRAL